MQPPAPIVEPAGLRQIAEGVWIIPDRRIPLVPNIGIVLGSHSALVIDTGIGLVNGRAVLQTARRLAEGRHLILTLTHFHPEHGYGASVFKSEALILYNRSQAVELAAKGDRYLAMFRNMSPVIDKLLEETYLVGPDIIYDGDTAEIDLGGRRVQLRSWGMAHTQGDQTVYLPDDGILFMGDLAEERMFPIIPWFPPDDIDVDVDRWIEVLASCAAMAPHIVVPGHGDLGGVEVLSAVREYLIDTGSAVRAAMRAGLLGDALVAECQPKILARHTAWSAPEWIDFAIRYFADKG